MVQREKGRSGGAGQRCGDGGEMRLNIRMLSLQIVPVRPNECVLFVVLSVCMCVCTAEAVFSLCVLVYACSRLSSGWLCSPSHATANCWLHSTCFVLTLLCSAPIISPGACAELDERALSNTLLLKSPSSAVFSFGLLRCRGHLCVRLLKAEGPGERSDIRVRQALRSFPWSLSGAEACLLSLMTLWQSRADQFRSTSCLEAPQCVF